MVTFRETIRLMLYPETEPLLYRGKILFFFGRYHFDSTGMCYKSAFKDLQTDD